jgi:predicted regulator of Ras-like GTPase activity (Roadblock/LC7/MglB family)
MPALQDMVRALRAVTKAEAVALINRDGSILATDLPGGISQETFSIMCAAILGAGMTAAMELHHAAPHRILLESHDVTMLISEIGRRAMLVVAIAPERSVSEILNAVERFAKVASKDLG